MELSIARKKFIAYLEFIDRSIETIRGYHVDISLFEKFLISRYGDKVELNCILVEDIEDFLMDMKIRGLAPASRNRRLYSLRSFFKYCLRKEFCNSNIAATVEIVRLPFKEREYLKEEEVLGITNMIKSDLIKHVVYVLFYSGLRITEALNLKLRDVSLEEGIIRVRSGKGQKDRSVPICPKLQIKLDEYLRSIRPSSHSDYFFATKRTGRLSAQYVNYAIHEAVEKLGWNRVITAHSFRHSFASALINKDVGVFHVQKLLGHADLRVTSRYCHANLNELKNAVNKL